MRPPESGRAGTPTTTEPGATSCPLSTTAPAPVVAPAPTDTGATKTVPEDQIVETLIEEAMRLAEEMGESDGETAGQGGPMVTVS